MTVGALDFFPSAGSNAYLSGSEVPRDLSSASFDAGSSLSDIGKTVILYSSTSGKSYKMPSANTSGMAAGKGTGFLIAPDSRPIMILNQGTVGTDDVLECLAMPGADFSLVTRSIATAKGDWRAKGLGLWAGAVPATLPAPIDAGTDLGSAATAGAFSNGTLRQNYMLTRLSSTQFLAAIVPTAGTSVLVYPISYNVSTDVWTWGSSVTAFSSANTWTLSGILALSSTQYIVAAYEGTTATGNARGGSVAANVITQGTAIVSGAWSITPSNAGWGSTSNLIKDAAGTCFHAGLFNGTNLGITHFSISGNNVTQDGGGQFLTATFTGISSNQVGGYSPSANVINLGITVDAVPGISKYTYATGSVTHTTKLTIRNFAGMSSEIGRCTLYPIDGANNEYLLMADNSSTGTARIKCDASLTTLSEAAIGPQLVMNTGNFSTSSICPISDGEFLGLGLGINPTFALTLFNPNFNLRRRSMNGTGPQAVGEVIHTTAGFGPAFSMQLSVDVDTTLRRAAFLHARYTTAGVASRQLALQMFNLPRNWSKETYLA